MTKIGFLGVGHLAHSLIEGLVRAGTAPGDLLLSPRGQAQAIGARYGIAVAPSNAALVEACDMVILATRPADALAAVEGLGWREGQVLVSACAGVGIEGLERAAGLAFVCRIMPLTAASLSASPTTLYPALPAVEDVIARLGPVIPLRSEDEFETATVSAAVYGWVQALIGTSARWQSAHGLDAGTARHLCALTFVAAGRMIAESEEPMENLLAELATSGGITARGLGVLCEHGTKEGWESACAAVLARLRGSG